MNYNTPYYSTLFLSKNKREDVLAVHKLYQQIMHIPRECNEQTIAMHKIEWWHEEINRLYQQQPQHPLTQQLLPACQSYRIPKQLFTNLLESIVLTTQRSSIANFDDLVLHCHHTSSLRELIVSYILTAADKVSLSFARDIGCYIGMIDIIRDLRLDIKQEIYLLPQNTINSVGIYSYTTSDRLKTELKLIADNARQIYDNALQKIPKESYKSLGYFIIQAEIYAELLKQIQASDFKVLENFIGLTPLKKFFIAKKINKKIMNRY